MIPMTRGYVAVHREISLCSFEVSSYSPSDTPQLRALVHRFLLLSTTPDLAKLGLSASSYQCAKSSCAELFTVSPLKRMLVFIWETRYVCTL
jgi:hypothetical protein